MANHDALIEQLRAWADALDRGLDLPAHEFGVHLTTVIQGMRECAADLERDQDPAARDLPPRQVFRREGAL